ncbi:MAG: lipocalin-like domain-containing protein [Actinomycetota bacterium]
MSASAALRGDPAANEAPAPTPRDPSVSPTTTARTPNSVPEWGYFTGNLDDAEGRPFGYQLTFFRIGQSPKPVSPDSPWRANTLYMAHFVYGALHHLRQSRPFELASCPTEPRSHPVQPLSRPSPLALARPRRQNAPNIAPRTEEGAQNAPIPGRGPVCLTAHEPGSTLHFDEKGRLKSLFPKMPRSRAEDPHTSPAVLYILMKKGV